MFPSCRLCNALQSPILARSSGADMSNKPRRSPDLPKTAIEALRRGALIEAIKVVRQERNIAFKEAKAEVEAYIFSQPALKKKMDKVLHTAQQKFVRWMVGFLVFTAGIVLLMMLGR